MSYDKTVSIKMSSEQYEGLLNYVNSKKMNVGEVIRELISNLIDNERGLIDALEFYKYQIKVIEDKISKIREDKKSKNNEKEPAKEEDKLKEMIHPIISQIITLHKNYNDYDDAERQKALDDFIRITKESLANINIEIRELFLDKLINDVNKFLFGFDKDKLNEIKEGLQSNLS